MTNETWTKEASELAPRIKGFNIRARDNNLIGWVAREEVADRIIADHAAARELEDARKALRDVIRATDLGAARKIALRHLYPGGQPIHATHPDAGGAA